MSRLVMITLARKESRGNTGGQAVWGKMKRELPPSLVEAFFPTKSFTRPRGAPLMDELQTRYIDDIAVARKCRTSLMDVRVKRGTNAAFGHHMLGTFEVKLIWPMVIHLLSSIVKTTS